MLRIAIFNDTRTANKHFGCQLVMQNLEYLLNDYGMSPVWYWPVNLNWLNHLDKLPIPGTVDAVIINGEGSMHDSVCNEKPDILASIAEYARDYLNVPTFLINTTLFNNTPEIYKKLESFEKLYLRDTYSLEEVAKYSVSKEFVPDLTLALPESDANNYRFGIGATDSVITKIDNSIKKICKANGWEYFPMVSKRINFAAKDLVRPLMLFRKTKSYVSSLTEKKLSGDLDDFKTWIKSKELIITGRYHTATLCILTKTPFVAIESNTSKISNLLKDCFADTNRLITDIEKLNKEKINQYLNFTENEQFAMEAFLNKANDKNKEMAKEIQMRTKRYNKNNTLDVLSE